MESPVFRMYVLMQATSRDARQDAHKLAFVVQPLSAIAEWDLTMALVWGPERAEMAGAF